MTRAFFAVPVIAAVALGGCATMMATQPDASAASTTYMAMGTEPFWNLEVTDNRLTFNRPDARPIVVRHGGWRLTPAARVIGTQRIRVAVTAGPCLDGMSDRRYVDTVRVSVDGRTFTGCGGVQEQAPAASLERSSWRITAVNGTLVVPDVEADLNFADGRISGSAGCNRLNGSFTQERNQLIFREITSTRRACPGPSGEQERRVLAVMRQPLTISFGERMTMTWTAPDGSTIALRRLDWD